MTMFRHTHGMIMVDHVMTALFLKPGFSTSKTDTVQSVENFSTFSGMKFYDSVQKIEFLNSFC